MNEFVEPLDQGLTRILVVDDEESIRKLLERLFINFDCRVWLAGDGMEAVSLLETQAIDVVVTDIAMPRMGGLELIKKVRDKFSCGVIAMTGQIHEYRYESLISLGADDFIQKPIIPEELVLRLKRVLRERYLKNELIRSHKELAQAQKLESIGLLAAGIAHEINTPIQYIGDNAVFIQDAFNHLLAVVNQYKTCLNHAKNGSIDEQMIEKMENTLLEADVDFLSTEIPLSVKQTLEGVGQVRKIVQSMKTFSHPGEGEKAMTDIHHTIENTVTIAGNEWKYCADLVLDLEPDFPMIRCDPGEIGQVLLNLIVNAAHAILEKNGPEITEKGIITIRTAHQDNWGRIMISDTGTGIPETIIDKVFDPFFTTKEIGKGTGQGLAISRSVIVDRHGGKLEIDTRPGEGTCFTISLPVQIDRE